MKEECKDGRELAQSELQGIFIPKMVALYDKYKDDFDRLEKDRLFNE